MVGWCWYRFLDNNGVEAGLIIVGVACLSTAVDVIEAADDDEIEDEDTTDGTVDDVTTVGPDCCCCCRSPLISVMLDDNGVDKGRGLGIDISLDCPVIRFPV